VRHLSIGAMLPAMPAETWGLSKILLQRAPKAKLMDSVSRIRAWATRPSPSLQQSAIPFDRSDREHSWIAGDRFGGKKYRQRRAA
jgi:hypothetical protein